MKRKKAKLISKKKYNALSLKVDRLQNLVYSQYKTIREATENVRFLREEHCRIADSFWELVNHYPIPRTKIRTPEDTSAD